MNRILTGSVIMIVLALVSTTAICTNQYKRTPPNGWHLKDLRNRVSMVSALIRLINL